MVDPVPKQDVVSAFERELDSTGSVLLMPSPWRVVGGQVPALASLAVGLILLTHALADGGRAWFGVVLLLGAGALGLWQIYSGLWGHGRRPIRVTPDGLYDDATGGHVAWEVIDAVELDEMTVRGVTIRRWVELVVPLSSASAWTPSKTRLGGFAGELREDADSRLGGASRLELPASLPEPVSVRKWLAEEVRRRSGSPAQP